MTDMTAYPPMLGTDMTIHLTGGLCIMHEGARQVFCSGLKLKLTLPSCPIKINVENYICTILEEIKQLNQTCHISGLNNQILFKKGKHQNKDKS